MRTIKFRGKDIMDEHWVYGDLETRPAYGLAVIHQYNEMEIYDHQCKVDKSSVGQFTGLQDSKGTDVYEGDILRYPQNNKTYQVVFKDGIFWGEGENGCGCAAHFFPSCEIVGNIHDNPELLEKGGDHE